MRNLNTMDQTEIFGVYKDCCRLCGITGRLGSVFVFKTGFNIPGLVSKHLSVSIQHSDTLSTKVCDDCLEKVVDFHNYFEACARTQETLTKWMLNDNCKAELNSDEVFIEEPVVVTELPIKNETCNDHCSTKDSKLNHVKNEIVDINKKSYIEVDICTTEEKTKDDFGDSIDSFRSNEDNFENGSISGNESDSSVVPLAIFSKKKKTGNKRHYTFISYSEFIDFHCFKCGHKCNHWLQLKRHSLEKHNLKPCVECKLCKVKLQSKTMLYQHVLAHRSPKIFKCEICPRITKTEAALDRHKQRHIPKEDRIYRCDQCPKTTKTKENLATHKITHIPIQERKIHTCDICNMKFAAPRSVIMHKRAVHEGIKKFMCDVCGYKCATKPELRHHRAKHSDEKQFTCQLCNKKYKTSSSLSTHMDTHEGTSYPCTICHKVLNTRRTFRRHQLVHTNEMKYVCSYCNTAFKRRQTLKAHLNSHTGDKPIACRWCSERFMYSGSYRSHKQRCHPDKLYDVDPNEHDNNAILPMPLLGIQ